MRINEFEMQVASLVNQERARVGLPALMVGSDVSRVARLKSEDMLTNQYLSHDSPNFGSFTDMLARFGIDFRLAGENIAAGLRTPEAVMNAWMNSTGHRDNVLNPSFTEIGVGFATDHSGDTYWTQIFLAR